MTMHIEGPWLTTTGRSRKNRKYSSAEAKQRAESNRKNWEDTVRKWGLGSDKKTKLKSTGEYQPMSRNPRYEDQVVVKSDKETWVACTKTQPKLYTGNMMLGISTLHKSNAVPVFSVEAARDISKMRRG